MGCRRPRQRPEHSCHGRMETEDAPGRLARGEARTHNRSLSLNGVSTSTRGASSTKNSRPHIVHEGCERRLHQATMDRTMRRVFIPTEVGDYFVLDSVAGTTSKSMVESLLSTNFLPSCFLRSDFPVNPCGLLRLSLEEVYTLQ